MQAADMLAAVLAVAAAAVWYTGRGSRWYCLVYRLFYLAGLRVWERHTRPADLIDMVEGPDALAPART